MTSKDLLQKLPQTTIQTFVNTLMTAKDPDGNPPRSLSVEMDLVTGETITVTVSRKKTEEAK